MNISAFVSIESPNSAVILKYTVPFTSYNAYINAEVTFFLPFSPENVCLTVLTLSACQVEIVGEWRIWVVSFLTLCTGLSL